MVQKIEIKGNDVLFCENMHLIEILVDDMQCQVKDFVAYPNVQSFDAMMRSAEQLHAYIGSLLSFLRYRAFEFDVLSETDTAEKSAVQKTE